MMTFIVPSSTTIKACCMVSINGWRASTTVEKLKKSSALRAAKYKKYVWQ